MPTICHFGHQGYQFFPAWNKLQGCEVAAVVADKHTRRWADGYVFIAVGLSMILNSVASGMHAEQLPALAYAVGGLIPVLVFILGKVASHLWTE
jgi:hypothetical protein